MKDVRLTMCCVFVYVFGCFLLTMEKSGFGHRFGIVLASFWHRFDIVLASFWRHFGIILASFGYHFGVILASFWRNFGIIGASFGSHLGIIFKFSKYKNKHTQKQIIPLYSPLTPDQPPQRLLCYIINALILTAPYIWLL